jgi:hypothetical protein
LRDLILFLLFTGLQTVFPIGINLRWLIIHVGRVLILMGRFFWLYIFQIAMGIVRILVTEIRLQEEGIYFVCKELKVPVRSIIVRFLQLHILELGKRF